MVDMYYFSMFSMYAHTYSSHCKSRVSLTRSLKHPSEYMLSSTSGSSSVRDRMRLTHTRLGGGCSGHGSLRPPLWTRAHGDTYWNQIIMEHPVPTAKKCYRNTHIYQGCFWMASSCKGKQQMGPFISTVC